MKGILVYLFGFLLSLNIYASDLQFIVDNHTLKLFQTGNVISSSEMNSNFNNLLNWLQFYTIIVEYDGQNIGLLRQCITGTNCQSGVFEFVPIIDWWPSNKGVDLFTISSAKLNPIYYNHVNSYPSNIGSIDCSDFYFSNSFSSSDLNLLADTPGDHTNSLNCNYLKDGYFRNAECSPETNKLFIYSSKNDKKTFTKIQNSLHQEHNQLLKRKSESSTSFTWYTMNYQQIGIGSFSLPGDCNTSGDYSRCQPTSSTDSKYELYVKSGCKLVMENGDFSGNCDLVNYKKNCIQSTQPVFEYEIDDSIPALSSINIHYMN